GPNHGSDILTHRNLDESGQSDTTEPFDFLTTARYFFFFFKQKTAYEIGLGIPAEPLFRSDKTLQVGYANHFYRSAHKFEQICRHRLRRQNVGYSNFSQPQSHLSFCVLLQYLVERRRVVTQLGKLD